MNYHDRQMLPLTRFLFKKINFTNLTIILCAVFALCSLWYFNQQKIYYVGSDIYYYFSLSDSINKFGELRDLTRIPSWSLKTPQNGIVFLINFFERVGFSKSNIITQTPILLFILYSLSFIPIYKITKLFKFNKTQSNLTALFYFSNWWVYRLQLLPINDGFFSVLVYWFIYFILENWINKKKTLVSVIAISIIASHFRIYIFFILLSLIIATYFSKERKNLFKSLLIFAISFVSLKLFFFTSYVNPLDQGTGAIGIQIKEMLTNFFTISTNNFFSPFATAFSNQINISIPSLFLTPLDNISPILNWLYLPVLLLPLIFLIKGLKRKNFMYIFISLITLTPLLFSLVTPYPSERHYLYIYIFIIILMIKFFYKQRLFKPFLFLYLFILMSHSLFSFSRDYQRSCRPLLLYQLFEQRVVLEDNAILISQEPRHSYYFLGKGHTDINNIQMNLENQNIYIFGSKDFINDQFIQITHNFNKQLTTKTIQSLSYQQEICSLIKLDTGQ